MTFTPKRKFQRETKPTIGNLDDELYQLENKKAKGAKRHANIKWMLKAKNAPKCFSKYLKDRICKIKPYLLYTDHNKSK